MIPHTLDPDATPLDVCAMSEVWGIDPQLAVRLYWMAALVPFGVEIYSGFRTAEEQAALEGNPELTAAPDKLSTHRSCPATGADVRPQVEYSEAVKRQMGAAAERAGLRWGGGARRVDGIPVGHEWKHFDLGPRRS